MKRKIKKESIKEKFLNFIALVSEYFSMSIFIIVFGYILSMGAIVLIPVGIYKFIDMDGKKGYPWNQLSKEQWGI